MGKAGGLLFLILVVALGAASLYAVSGRTKISEPQSNVVSKVAKASALTPPATPLADRKLDSVAAQNMGISKSPDDEFTPTVHEALNLAARLDQSSPSTTADFDAQVTALAEKLTLADATLLQDIATTSTRSHNSRYLAVFLMSQRPEVFAHQLEEVAGSESEVLSKKPVAHTQGEQQRHFEEALHAQALGALDRLNLVDNREKPFFTQLQETHSNPFVRKLARMGAVGADQRKALIDQYTNTDR